MKKVLMVAVVVALVSMPAFAAELVKAGSMLLGGDANFKFNYNSYTYEGEDWGDADWDPLTNTTMGIGLYGKFGYFVIDSLAVGPILGINYTSFTEQQHDEEGKAEALDPVTTLGFDFGPWVGYYFDLGSAFYPYVSLGFLLNYSSETNPNVVVPTQTGESETIEVTTTKMLYGPAFWAGALVNFADGWALDLGLQFKYLFGTETEEPEEGDSYDYSLSNLDIGLFVGINVFF